MKKILLTVFTSTLFFVFGNAQEFISSEYKGGKTKDELTATYGVNLFEYDVEYHKITYTTLDVHGVLDTASGLVVVPTDSQKKFPLLCYQHGTVGSKWDVPSNLEGGYELAEVWAGGGYLVFAPDYLGLGEARGFHPYVHRASEASAAIDMYYATKAFADSYGAFYNEQLFITGYSQGGHAAAALHKELEENYNSEISVTASAPMSGPYSISGVMNDFMFSLTPYNFVAYLPYTVLSYQTVYGDLYNDLEEVFKPTYAVLIQEFYDGTRTLGSLNNALIAMLTDDYGASLPLKMIKDSVADAVANNPNHPLNVAMRDNDVFDWAPQAPTRFYYCEADDQVIYLNSIVADSVMNALGAPNTDALSVGADLDHGECVEPAVLNAYFFFLGYQVIDDISSTENRNASDFKIFPNPASNFLFIQNEKNEIENLRLVDLNGKLILEKKINTDKAEIDISNLATGIYFLKIKTAHSFFTKKIWVRNF